MELVLACPITLVFFPADAHNLSRFSEQVLDDIKNIDILGSWLPGEAVVSKYFPNAKIIPLRDVEPYYHENPWSESLKERKVLIVSPFSKSIEKQFWRNRRHLFKDHRILPEFDLLTLQAVQSIGGIGAESGFKSWFDALDWMCSEIDKMDFEIAIIGAGAYGLSLAAHVKKIGRKAVHMGGATQIMFGIKGKRWDNRPFFRNLYNEYWIRPSSEETPKSFNKIESGCYW